MVFFNANMYGKDAVMNLMDKTVIEIEEFVALRNAKSANEAKPLFATENRGNLKVSVILNCDVSFYFTSKDTFKTSYRCKKISSLI